MVIRVAPMRATSPFTWSPTRSKVTEPIFFGSPKVSRPPVTDCSVVMGMKRA
jgi:hypothetical protein